MSAFNGKTAKKEKTTLTEPVGDDTTDADQQMAQCGIGSFKPAMLENCANITVFTSVYSVSALMTSTLASYVNGQVTTLERHFGFSSTQTGLIMASNDIGFLTIVLFVSFLAPRVHIPRALASFTILYGLSGIVCALPYFLFGAPDPASSPGADVSNDSTTTSAAKFLGQLCGGVNQTALTCNVSGEDPLETPEGPDPEWEARRNSGTALLILVIGMMMQGAAKTPRSSFTIYYVDSTVHSLHTGFYMGIIIAIALVGPAVAYALGGVFSRIYVTLEDTDMHYRHPGWIGAWWLGYLTFGCISCLSALPLFLFPRRMKSPSSPSSSSPSPTTRPHRAHRDAGTVFKRVVHFQKGFLAALWRLCTNPVYMCCVLSACAVVFSVAGGHSFTAKYIENQFAFAAWRANIALAGAILFLAGLGTFLGGYISRRLKMGPMKCVKYVMIVMTCTAISQGMLLLFYCDQPDIVNSPGPRGAAVGEGKEGCVEGCGCDDGRYFPVCGGDGLTYFSPCHAGCASAVEGSYVNCTCIDGGRAEAGMCDYSCVMFYPWLLVFCVASLFSTIAIIPHLLMTVRSVQESDKALGVGFSSFATSVTGWMLAPICFGKLIDGVCIQWEAGCGEGGGACLLYDNDKFRWKLLGWQAFFRFLALFFSILAFVAAKWTHRLDDPATCGAGKDVSLAKMAADPDAKDLDPQSAGDVF